MKILHTPFAITTGGREVFIRKIIEHYPDKSTEHQGLTEGDQIGLIDSSGVQLQVLPKAITSDFRRTYFSGIYDALPGFSSLLEEYAPDIVHFHDQGTRASLSHLQLCKQKGIKTLLTFHSPGQICMQRSLWINGVHPCDGLIDYHRCAECQYRVAGIPASFAKALSYCSPPFDKKGIVFKYNVVKMFYESIREYFKIIDAIQIHAHWVENMLLRFGVEQSKLHFLEMGGQPSFDKSKWKKNTSDPLKLVYIGRCQEEKGVHLLVNAVKMLPMDASVEVHFFGPYWDSYKYGKNLLKSISSDRRFMQPRLVPQDQICEVLIDMDVCVVPSLWPETGPLTVFDAFSVGLPVIGTRLAGIAERVQDGKTGLLFDWNDAESLKLKILEYIRKPELVMIMKNNIRENITFKDMSVKFCELYNLILK